MSVSATAEESTGVALTVEFELFKETAGQFRFYPTNHRIRGSLWGTDPMDTLIQHPHCTSTPTVSAPKGCDNL